MAAHLVWHNEATRLLGENGIEAARSVLRHRSALVREIHARIDRTKAVEVTEMVG